MPSALQEAMILGARHGGAEGRNIEQVVVPLGAQALALAGATDGPAPAARLERALPVLVARHEGLRLRVVIGAEGGTPLLEVQDNAAAGVPLEQAAQTGAGLAGFLAQDRARGFDLGAGCGWRLTHLTGSGGGWLVLTAHHALFDLTAMEIVLDELFCLLTDRPLGPAPQQIGEALAAAATAATAATATATVGERLAELEALRGEAERALAFARPAGGAHPEPMQRVVQQIGAAVTARLTQRAMAAGGNLFSLLLAAHALTLARLTGSDTAVFGVTLSGRRATVGQTPAVGCLITTQPFVACMKDLPDLDGLIRRCHSQSLMLRAAQHGPGMARAAEAEDLRFDTLVVYSRRGLADRLTRRGHDPALTTGIELLEEGETPLTLAVYGEEALELVIEHDPLRVSDRQAADYAQALNTLLLAMADAPAATGLGALPLLSAAQTAELIALGEPSPPLPPDAGSGDLFDRLCQLAAQRGGDEALVEEAEPGASRAPVRLSYAALVARVQGLAQAIGALGLPPGSLVALNLPRGAEYVVGLLAVLASGHAFLPLDLELPEAERSLRASEAGIGLVLGHDGIKGLSAPLLSPANCPASDRPRAPVAPADLAYVIHTSGSTGRPKGVMGRQSALIAHARACQQAYGLGPGDRVLQFANNAFDVSLEEILPTLLSGATLVLRAPGATLSVAAFLDRCGREGITVLNLPASFWHVLTREAVEAGLAMPPGLRLLVTGSERIDPAVLALWRARFPAITWINGYGPTEATITTVLHRLAPGDPASDPGQDVPIGRPMGHARLRVLGFDGSLVPRGVPGQLAIGGAAVTLGYRHNAEATEAAFVADLWAAGERMYLTGDRVAWDAFGNLRYLGRGDRQIKLRGLRLDLGEIERIIGQLKGVEGVFVDVEATASANARLVAWVRLRAGSGVTAADLSAAVADHLSGAALPVFVPVGQFPTRPNGKIDRSRLPAPASLYAPPQASAEEADTATQTVAGVVAELIGQPAVGADQDLRDLGVNSLVVLRLMSRLSALFGRDLVAADVYRNPTARQLSAFLTSTAEASGHVIPIRNEGAAVPFLAIHVLGDRESLYRPLAAALGPGFPVHGLTIGVPQDLDAISVSPIAETYFQQIQRSFPTGPVALGAVSLAAYFAFDLAQRLIAAGREVRVLVVFDATGPGGRPSLRGLPKVRAHLGRLLTEGPAHLSRIRRNRREHRQIEAELQAAQAQKITGAALVLANVRAVEAYQPQPLACPILVFRADESFWDDAQARGSALGWRQVAAGGVEMIDVPGGHLTMLAEPHAAAIAAHLRKVLGGSASGS